MIYVDCDGVLADFDGAFQNHFKMLPRAYEDKFGTQRFWHDLKKEMPDFFLNLKVLPDAGKLLVPGAVILTGCPHGKWAEQQKLIWAGEHFPGTKIICCLSKNKKDFCKPKDILIDDTLKYRHLWEEAGGFFIHHTSVENSLLTLDIVTNLN